MFAFGLKNVGICSARLIALLEALGMSRLLASPQYKRQSLQFCLPHRCWIKVNFAAVAKLSTSTRRLSRRTLIFWLVEVLYAREHFERLCPPSLLRKEGDDPDNDTNKHNNAESTQPALMELGAILSASGNPVAQRKRRSSCCLEIKRRTPFLRHEGENRSRKDQ